MGMVGRIGQRWSELNRKYVASSQRASDVGGGLGAMSKVLRMMLQSAILAVGAWLVINQKSTPGIIIAGSILGGRALAPVDLAIANWRGFVAARQSWQRLSRLLGASAADRAAPMPLQPPTAHARRPEGRGRRAGRTEDRLPGCQLLARRRQGARRHRARPHRENPRWRACWSGSGRRRAAPSGSTAPRIDQWSPEALGRHIGYLPQDVELFPGNVAQNIARFEDPPDPEAVLAAAQAAGVHDLDRQSAGRL